MCTCEVSTNDDGTVTLRVTGTISWCTGHTGFPVDWTLSGACVSDLLATLRGFYEDWNTQYVNKVDLCDLNGRKVDLAGLLGRTSILNDSDNRDALGF